MVLWCYAAEQRVKILAITSSIIYSLGGQVPATVLIGQQTDISALAETGWYELVYYRDSESSFPYPVERQGRCLGPCEHKGTVMSQHILNDQEKCTAIPKNLEINQGRTSKRCQIIKAR